MIIGIECEFIIIYFGVWGGALTLFQNALFSVALVQIYRHTHTLIQNCASIAK